jgi:hypothetical protein
MTTFYGEQHRRLQDQFDSHEIADVLAAAIVRPDIDDEAKAFIESRTFFFLSTVVAHGQPTVSHKGGAAGFVRVIDPMKGDYPGADLVVRATVFDVFVNCPRYITPHTPGTPSRYVPDANGKSPLPGWKKIDALQPFLPARFQGLAAAEDDLITADEYGQRLLQGDG